MYENIRDEAQVITPECTYVRVLCMEEDRFPTTVECFKFPFVSERYVVLTVYKVPDYKKPGEHLYVASSRGNKDKQTPEYLGKDFLASRVLVEPDISTYQCIRKADGKIYLRWLTSVPTDGVPMWIYKSVHLMKFPTIFKGIYGILAKQKP
jgi:hypothetical protein